MSDARALLAEVLQLDADTIGDDAAIGITDRWDSLAHMHLILALEQTLGRTLETDVMLEVDNLAAIQALLDEAG